MRRMRISFLASLVALGGCGASSDAAGNGKAEDAAAADGVSRSTLPAAPTPARATITTAMTTAQRSCSTEIGAAAAARRVAVCRNVSPATHPPCNAVNSCAMIEHEIARSCALFDGSAPTMKGCSPDSKGMQAAADVVRRYYSAVDARDYGTAWAQWGVNGPPGQAFKAFKDGFAHTRSTRVTIGSPDPGGGGAGSIYQPVPVTVDATLDDGTRQRFAGTYVVRRVNDVDGASGSQLRWHLGSAELRRIPF
jgi:hypothetical protein